MLKTICYSLAAVIRKILFSPLENIIHIFAPPCSILFNYAIVSHAVIVFGALLGTQEGRSMEILNSFELQYDIIDNDVVINTDYYHAKAEQCK